MYSIHIHAMALLLYPDAALNLLLFEGDPAMLHQLIINR